MGLPLAENGIFPSFTVTPNFRHPLSCFLDPPLVMYVCVICMCVNLYLYMSVCGNFKASLACQLTSLTPPSDQHSWSLWEPMDDMFPGRWCYRDPGQICSGARGTERGGWECFRQHLPAGQLQGVCIPSPSQDGHLQCKPCNVPWVGVFRM